MLFYDAKAPNGMTKASRRQVLYSIYRKKKDNQVNQYQSTGGSHLMRISLLRFFKKIHKFTLCVVLMQILFHQCDFLGCFLLMRIWLMQIFSRTKSNIRQEISLKFCLSSRWSFVRGFNCMRLHLNQLSATKTTDKSQSLTTDSKETS